MKTKENVSDEDINEMLEEYKKLYAVEFVDDGRESTIVYKGETLFSLIYSTSTWIDIHFIFRLY